MTSRANTLPRWAGILGLLFAPVWASAHGAAEPGAIAWLRSDTAAFAQARAEHRFVVLYLEAVWCHWCHVMDEKTYGDGKVRAEIAAHYVPLRIDQDLRPDLANRYKDYGWPATVVFAPDGSEIAKRQGFIEPERFLRLLRAIEKDPSPENVADADSAATPADATGLDAQTRAELVRRHHATFDATLGGLAIEQKYLDRDSVEYAITHATAERGERDMATTTLDAARALFDPVWGGVYQYSTFSDWKHPHYEKLATEQAEYLRVYILAAATLGRAQDRAAVAQIERYLRSFLTSPGGAFFTSQDADLRPGEHSHEYFSLGDAARRAQGLPRVDHHLYALQNGLLIEALASASELTGDEAALGSARRAAEWAIAHRGLAEGGFRHDEHDAAGPYLGDSLAMGRAFLALYRATADRVWLTRAAAALDFIGVHFRSPKGFVSARGDGPIAATSQLAENIALARFANLLSRYTGSPAHADIAKAALAWIAQQRVALAAITEPGVLLAADEAAREPLHLTVIGAKDDPAARALFAAVQRLPAAYKRLEWWDKAEGPLPNADVSYPAPKRAAAFICTETRCSLPIFNAADVAAFVAESGKGREAASN
ncbi:MAG: DUF255 domain-containing protein [Rudaea sp.]